MKKYIDAEKQKVRQFVFVFEYFRFRFRGIICLCDLHDFDTVELLMLHQQVLHVLDLIYGS